MHIANICKKPIQSPTDVVKKGEEVWVKVGRSSDWAACQTCDAA